MANLAPNAEDVIAQPGAKIVRGVNADDFLTAGCVVAKYQDGTITKATGLDEDPVYHKPIGIALHGSSPGQPIRYMTHGRVSMGAILTVGKHYVLSGSNIQSNIAPVDDVVAGWPDAYVGRAISTSILELNFSRSESDTVEAASNVT